MRLYPFLALAALSLTLAGCGHDAVPTAPEAAAASAVLQDQALAVPMAASKLDGLWPNEDGRTWSYDLRYNNNPYGLYLPNFYATKEEVPAAPSPEDVLPTLRQSIRPVNIESAVFGLRFDGQKTTESGAVGQNLVESAELVSGAGARLVPDVRTRLLARLAQARQGLRSRLTVQDDSLPPAVYFTPLLLHGGAWERTLQYIGTYGDLDRDLAWKFLDADTRQGASFRFQLVKAFANNVFLTGWVVPHRSRSAETRGRVLEVVYVIDYGLTTATDPGGQLLGYTRFVTYGSVTYLPGEGPTGSKERFATVDDLVHPFDEISTTLRSASGPLALR